MGWVAQADDDKADPELKKFEGKWTTPAGDGGKVTYTFKGKKLKIEAPSRTYEMTVKIDSAAKPDKTIDFEIDESPDDAKGKTSKGIYKFDGDSQADLLLLSGGRPADQVRAEWLRADRVRADQGERIIRLKPRISEEEEFDHGLHGSHG